jgi:hypothetical protein
MQPSASPQRRSRFIEGIYNYCDHWCERCRFQTRCRVYRDMQVHLEGDASRPDLPLDADDDDRREPPSPEIQAWLEEIEQTPSESEMRRFEEQYAREKAAVEAHPLTRAADDYADITRRLLTVLEDGTEGTDPVLSGAFDTIGRFNLTIAVKTRRAVGGLMHEDDLDHEEGVQTDANGTAKLVRLLIRESRDAWLALDRADIGAAEGIPRTLINRLDNLDHAMATAFPLAMAFVRAGFDDDVTSH